MLENQKHIETTKTHDIQLSLNFSCRLGWGVFRVALFCLFRCLHESGVGRTHTVVRLQTRICRKDGTENFGGFVYVQDLHNGIFCCWFLYVRLISVSLFRLPHRGLPRPTDTPRAITPLPPLHGYHACVYIPAITP